MSPLPTSAQFTVFHRRLTSLCIVALLALLGGSDARAAVRVLASHHGAFVTHDAGSGVWTIGNSTVSATFRVVEDDQLILTDLTNRRTGRSLNIGHHPDTTLAINDNTMTLGGRSSGLSFVDANADALSTGVHLSFTYADAALHVRLERHYACYPGSPTIET